MNVLIVESKNDQAFIEAVIRSLKLQIQVAVDTPICNIDDFECLNGLNLEKLRVKFEDVFGEIAKKGIDKIGIILDLDQETTENRLKLINEALKIALKNVFDFTQEALLVAENQLVIIPVNENTQFALACHFTNVDGAGELENVLKSIKTQASIYADCLQSWRECVESNGKKLSDKEFVKMWVDAYIRWDTCSRNDKKQAERKCSMKNFDYVMTSKSTIFDLNAELLNNLKTYLRLFN
jgi:hypothetical protein